MRNGLSSLAPLALVAGLVVACSGAERRSGFDTSATDDGGTTGGFNNVDAGAGQDGCSEAKTEISRIPVVIQFVIDESTSMNPDKWVAARDALLAGFEDMQKTADPATFVGAYLYPKNTSVQPNSLTDANHYNNLVNLVNVPKGTGGSTPTLAALQTNYQIVETFTPPVSTGLVKDEMRRVVVL